ncbi:MAG: M61 family peptidase [Deltaproteobacteria bacterium]|nr:MAG: M61 family peptidase [Deltaproteobacteria bacterium]
MSEAIQYTVVPSNPAGHVFTVTVTVEDPDPSGQIFTLPAWIPGSYLVRDFAKHLGPVRAECDGTPCAIRKLDKQTWQAAPCSGSLRLTYEVYAWDLSVRKAHLDRTHGYFNGTSLFLAARGRERRPQELCLQPPLDPSCEGWQVATTLPRRTGDPLGFGRFLAKDYDELIDHPVEMGLFEHATFDASGIPHEIAITGRYRCDTQRLCRDLKAICEGHLRTFGIPTDLDRYLFQIMVVGSGYGGLEHRSSTSLICSRGDLPQLDEAKISDGYRTLLALASHEYVHNWNVKRIKPAAFTPFDLSRECHTTLLWAFEGITAYYEPLGLVRTGLIRPQSFLELIGRKLTDVMRRAGRFKQSVAQSSFDAWTKFYQQDENATNAIVSYYTKGAMVALALDLTLRRGTDGSTCLDDVMRALYERHGETGVGVPEDGVQRVASEVSGLDLSGFFEMALHGTGDALWEELVELLRYVGLRAHLRPREGMKDRGGKEGKVPPSRWETRGDLGFGLRGTSTKVVWVREGSPAMVAGLSAGDTIVAFDGLKATSSLPDEIAARAPGEVVTLHVFRRDELHTLEAIVARPPLDTAWIEILDDEPGAARRRAWLQPSEGS